MSEEQHELRHEDECPCCYEWMHRSEQRERDFVRLLALLFRDHQTGDEEIAVLLDRLGITAAKLRAALEETEPVRCCCGADLSACEANRALTGGVHLRAMTP